MEEITFEVETVTPLFIAGADQRNIENEGLRTPSLRGAMRWWFRAVAGGAKLSSGSINGKKIKEEEEEIWGAADKKSKVSISTFSINSRISSIQNIRERGIKYLSYGSSDRPCIEPGGKFRVDIRLNSTISDEEKNRIVATIWLLLNLGNIGSKSRKGFGSLRITKDTTINGISFKNPKNIDELEKYLKINIKKCLELFGWDGSTHRGSIPPPFSVITPNFWKMKILDNIFTSATDAINDIGKKLREHREDRKWVTKDYDSVKSIYTHNPTSVPPKGSIFGLPHQFYFPSINKKAMVRGTKSERRASPLHIKVWNLNENQYVIGLQLFKSKFLPEDKLLISDLSSQKVSAQTSPPSYNFLESFLNGLPGRLVSL